MSRSLIDYICVSGTMERNVLEFVDHLHEHFVTPCSINARGRYNIPVNPREGYRYVDSSLFYLREMIVNTLCVFFSDLITFFTQYRDAQIEYC